MLGARALLQFGTRAEDGRNRDLKGAQTVPAQNLQAEGHFDKELKLNSEKKTAFSVGFGVPGAFSTAG